ncbi:MAG: hypothetical protein Q9220_005262 [cf. Caloplaca sp. 1 TL-2023]
MHVERSIPGICIPGKLSKEWLDEEIAKEEAIFDDSIQAKWPKTAWNGNVEVYGGRLGHEGDNADTGDLSAAELTKNSPNEVEDVSFNIWPYPPRRQHEDTGRWDSNRMWFNLYTDCYPNLNSPIRRVLPHRHSLSSPNVERVQMWLQDCDRDHEGCQRDVPGPLPTRVIDIGPADGSQDPKLVVSNGERLPYVALSHCWGSPPQSKIPRNARTLTSNFESMKCGILMESLPQNFKDAIVTVRALNLRYLWIDALCIIQDSEEDWRAEAALMDQVYGSAYFTLSATSASSSIEGFLERPPWPFPIVKITYPIGGGRSICAGNVYFRYQPDYSKYSREDAIDGSMWNTRGWTYQERLLSRRILHFARGRLYWECRSTEGSEENEPPRALVYRSRWMDDEPQRKTVYPDEEVFDNRFERWYRLVSKYSERELSFATDTLPALSGLANAFRQLNALPGTDYLFGIWRQDILRGLLWMTKDSAQATRYSGSGAPSWSWASIKGDLDWPSRTIERHCHYNYSASFLPLDTCNSLTNGSRHANHDGTLVLQAKCLSLDAVRRPPEWGALVRFPLDVIHERQVVGNGAFDVDVEAQEYGNWAMQIELQGPGDSFFPYHPSFLLLRKEVTYGEDVYRRVGYGALEEDFRALFETVESVTLRII